MRLEKYIDWFFEQDKYPIDHVNNLSKAVWNHQQQKILDILDYISLIGHQKELDHFLKTEKGWE